MIKHGKKAQTLTITNNIDAFSCLSSKYDFEVQQEWQNKTSIFYVAPNKS